MKVNEINELSSQELRIKIAQINRWKWCSVKNTKENEREVVGVPPWGEITLTKDKVIDESCIMTIPHYTDDLNVMQEMVMSLDYSKQIEFTHSLGKVIYGEVSNPNDWTYLDFITADARIWAEAYLLTLLQKS